MTSAPHNFTNFWRNKIVCFKIENLSFVYNQGMPGETKALDNINLDIEEGSFVGIIGHTGSGKSTLISHLNGLTKPQSGRILLEGKDIWKDY